MSSVLKFHGYEVHVISVDSVLEEMYSYRKLELRLSRRQFFPVARTFLSVFQEYSLACVDSHLNPHDDFLYQQSKLSFNVYLGARRVLLAYLDGLRIGTELYSDDEHSFLLLRLVHHGVLTYYRVIFSDSGRSYYEE